MDGRGGQSSSPELGAAVTACIPDLLCALASTADAAEQARRVVEQLTAAARPVAGGLVK